MNEIIEITNQKQYKDTLDNNTGRMVVLFTAPAWCPPCRAFEPQFNKLPQMTDATLVRVDIDHNPWTAGDIRAVPTIRLYDGVYHIRDLRAAGAEAFAKSITE